MIMKIIIANLRILCQIILLSLKRLFLEQIKLTNETYRVKWREYIFVCIHKAGDNVWTLPMKAEEPPSFAIPTATFAGAPPGAFLKPGASASETPETVGTKSINSSPKHTTSGFFFWDPFFFIDGDFGEPISKPIAEISNRSIQRIWAWYMRIQEKWNITNLLIWYF